MPLNEQKGNMYQFVTHTFNIIKGKCPHDCVYCYMKGLPQGELRIDTKEFKTNLGSDKYIFVGSSTDMWAREVPDRWIEETLSHCNMYPENTYLFQSKDPERFSDFMAKMPPKTVLGCTIESNRGTDYAFSHAPLVEIRKRWMLMEGVRKMISIEPVMDFDTRVMVEWMRQIGPEFISIGADSKGHNLPEPPADKLRELLEELVKITEVRMKDNLRRLLK